MVVVTKDLFRSEIDFRLGIVAVTTGILYQEVYVIPKKDFVLQLNFD